MPKDLVGAQEMRAALEHARQVVARWAAEDQALLERLKAEERCYRCTPTGGFPFEMMVGLCYRHAHKLEQDLKVAKADYDRARERNSRRWWVAPRPEGAVAQPLASEESDIVEAIIYCPETMWVRGRAVECQFPAGHDGVHHHNDPDRFTVAWPT